MFKFLLFSSLNTVVSKYVVAKVLRDYFGAEEPVAVNSFLAVSKNNWFDEFTSKYDLVNKELKINPPVIKDISSYREFIEEYTALTAFIYELKVLYTHGLRTGREQDYFGCSYEEFLNEITPERTYFSEVLSETEKKCDLITLGKNYGWIYPSLYLSGKYLEIGVRLKEFQRKNTWIVHHRHETFFKNMRKIGYFLSYFYYPAIYELRKRLREIYGERVRELIMKNPETLEGTYSKDAVVVLLGSKTHVIDFTENNLPEPEKIY